MLMQSTAHLRYRRVIRREAHLGREVEHEERALHALSRKKWRAGGAVAVAKQVRLAQSCKAQAGLPFIRP